MGKTTTTRYDLAEHLRTPGEMAAYLEASFEEANGDAAFIVKRLGVRSKKAWGQKGLGSGLAISHCYPAPEPTAWAG